jgi:hypothetical protein
MPQRPVHVHLPPARRQRQLGDALIPRELLYRAQQDLVALGSGCAELDQACPMLELRPGRKQGQGQPARRWHELRHVRVYFRLPGHQGRRNTVMAILYVVAEPKLLDGDGRQRLTTTGCGEHALEALLVQGAWPTHTSATKVDCQLPSSVNTPDNAGDFDGTRPEITSGQRACPRGVVTETPKTAGCIVVGTPRRLDEEHRAARRVRDTIGNAGV